MPKRSKFKSVRKKKQAALHKKAGQFLLVFALIAGVSFYLDHLVRAEDQEPKVASEVTQVLVEETTTTTSTIPKKENDMTEEQLIQDLNKLLATKQGTYGIYVYELTEKRGFGINEDRQFYAASTAKVPLLMKLYSEINAGRISKNQKMTYTANDYEPGAGSIQNSKYGSVWTVEQLATKMIKESDNVAKNMLFRLLKRSNVEQYIYDNFGTKKIDLSINTQATPEEMSILLEGIYNQKVASAPLTEEMLSLMTKTYFENRLPRYLGGVRVAHKIGTWSGSISDVGIVFADGHPFVISVYSEGVAPADGEQTIAEVAKKVYQYEISK